VNVGLVDNWPLSGTSEQNISSAVTKATVIVDQLIESSPAVTDLIRRLRQNPSADERSVTELQLGNEFEAALHQGGVPPKMGHALAHMMAHNADIPR